MSNISVGVGTKVINLRVANPTNNAQPVKKTEKPQEEIKLRGIKFREEPQPQKDVSDVNQLRSGSVPANTDLPDLFSDNNVQQVPQQQDYNQPQYPTGEPQTQSSGNAEMATGIGMAIGGVGGAILGNKFGFKKLGIAVGVAVGGFIGNKVGQ